MSVPPPYRSVAASVTTAPATSINFKQAFPQELVELAQMEKDSLVELDHRGIQVNAPGRLLIRRFCMVFDAWLRKAEIPQTYSRFI